MRTVSVDLPARPMCALRICFAANRQLQQSSPRCKTKVGSLRESVTKLKSRSAAASGVRFMSGRGESRWNRPVTMGRALRGLYAVSAAALCANSMRIWIKPQGRHISFGNNVSHSKMRCVLAVVSPALCLTIPSRFAARGALGSRTCRRRATTANCSGALCSSKSPQQPCAGLTKRAALKTTCSRCALLS